MKKYSSGQRVSYGVYGSVWPPDLCLVSADGEALEGKLDTTYWRLPLLLVVAAGPVLGGLFILAFLVIVIAAVVTAVGEHIYRRVGALREPQSHLLRLHWEPVTSYLQRSADDKHEAEGGGGAEPGDELADIAGEVRARRARESR